MVASLKGGGGLIPAHAGSTECWTIQAGWGWAHPRSRGEHKIPALWWRTMYGSSPLTRGALPELFRNLYLTRLIPAHAGSTGPAAPPSPKSTAHPRSRGEHDPHPRGVRVMGGSSPLTRGARGGEDWPEQTVRAHPRSRGEHVTYFPTRPQKKGSSPLTRGAHRGAR